MPEAERGLFELPFDEQWEPAHWARFIRGGFERDADGTIAIPDRPGLASSSTGSCSTLRKRVYHGSSTRVAAAVLREHGLREAVHLRDKKASFNRLRQGVGFTLPEPPF